VPTSGLDEDEQDREACEPDRLDDRPALPQPPGAVGEEAGQEEDEQQLPELRGLEAERPDVEPALRMARDGAAEQHEQHQAGRAAVDPALVAPIDLRVDEEQRDEADAADRCVDPLADNVVVGVALHVVRGDPGDRPEPKGQHRDHGAEQPPVEPAAARTRRRPPRRGAAAALARAC
jgi:hypothetical protein